MAQIPATRGNPHASEIAVQDALPLVGSNTREDGQTVLTTIDSDLARLYEDKNILLTDGGTISWSGTALSFSASLKLEVNSRATGVAPVIIDLAATTRTFSTDGAMLYAVINRAAGTATVTADVITLPATVSANKELFLIAKRKGTDIVMRNGFSLSAGESAKLGQVGTVLDTKFAVGDSTDSTKKIAFDAGGTTATTTTIAAAQTANRIQTLQDTSDTFVYRSTTDTLSGKQIQYSVSTDSTTTGANATLAAFTTGTIRLTNASLTSIAGIPAGSASQILIVENKTGATITIANDDSGASASNRIFTGAGGTVTMPNNATFAFTYDATDSRWMLTGGSGSGSGSGGINYITYGDAESGTQGWVTYADAAATSPVDGTGGSPNVTWTTSSTSPLRGLSSYLFTKDAANRQGQGVSYDFSIDNASKAKVLSIKFDYICGSGFTAGSSSTDSDITVWIYDVTNTRLIQPSSYKLLSNSNTIADQFQAEFQTSADSTSYRLIFHIGTTSATAWSIKVDNIVVSPSEYVFGTPIGPWEPYTPTFSNLGTPTAINVRFRRVGSNDEIQGRWTNGTVGGGNAAFSLPPGATGDTNGVDIVVGDYGHQGSATGSAVVYSSANNNFYFGMNNWGTPATGTQMATGAFTSVNLSIPIAGQSSSVQMSDQTSTRIVAFQAFKNGGTGTANTTLATWTTVVEDTHGAFNPSTGVYTVPVAGDYLVAGSLATTSGSGIFNIRQNATERIRGSSSGQSSASGIVKCVAGDQITIALESSLTLVSQERNTFTIYRISGPSQIAATETIAMSYSSTSGPAIGTGATAIAFATKDFDTHGSYSGSTFTTPAAGKYRVSVRILTTAVTLTTSQRVDLIVNKNGAQYSAEQIYGNGGANISYTVQLSDTIHLNQGDTLQVLAASSVATSASVAAGFSRLCIERIGN